MIDTYILRAIKYWNDFSFWYGDTNVEILVVQLYPYKTPLNCIISIDDGNIIVKKQILGDQSLFDFAVGVFDTHCALICDNC